VPLNFFKERPQALQINRVATVEPSAAPRPKVEPSAAPMPLQPEAAMAIAVNVRHSTRYELRFQLQDPFHRK
jgi:hypothetical protein